MRTRILGRLLNDEVEEYLKHNDTIIVPVGTTEMHGGFPLDSETVVSEAMALKLAEKADSLVLTGLPYFYAGATASGRGTVEVSIREGIDYLGAIARSLLRQGFKRQVYLSLHGPAHMTISPMIRDFYDETGYPILYMDSMLMMAHNRNLFTSMDAFHEMVIGAYKIFGRLDDIPITDKYYHTDKSSMAGFDDIFSLGYQSAAVGYYFGEHKDHMSTPIIKDEADREAFADRGIALIDKITEATDIKHIFNQLTELKKNQDEVKQRFPWVPSNNN